MAQSHVVGLAKNIPKGLDLFFTNPILALGYFRKLCYEALVFPMFSPPLHFERNIKGVQFNFDVSHFPVPELSREKRYTEFVKRAYFDLYFDLYEINVRQYMEKVLQSGDIFIDVGANIGYLSALGASLIGKEGQVHCFEPSPVAFRELEKLPQNNPGYHIAVNNVFLGETPSVAMMEYGDGGGTSLVAGFMEEHHTPIIGKAELPVIRLDAYLEKNNINTPRLIKIDVEGFEFPVLKGLENYFKNNNYRPTIICEIQSVAYSSLGYTLREFAAYMEHYGYKAYDIWNPSTAINITKINEDKGFDVIWKAES